MEFKDFPKIQGLFMTVRTLLQFNRKFPISDLKDMVPISKESKRYDWNNINKYSMTSETNYKHY